MLAETDQQVIHVAMFNGERRAEVDCVRLDVVCEELKSGGSLRNEEPNRTFVANGEIEDGFFSRGAARSVESAAGFHGSCLSGPVSPIAGAVVLTIIMYSSLHKKVTSSFVSQE